MSANIIPYPLKEKESHYVPVRIRSAEFFFTQELQNSDERMAPPSSSFPRPAAVAESGIGWEGHEGGVKKKEKKEKEGGKFATYSEVLQVIEREIITEQVKESILEHATVAVAVDDLVRKMRRSRRGKTGVGVKKMREKKVG